MKLSIQTSIFQSMVAKAVKGASLNGNLRITQLMAISLEKNTLTLTTTDGNNFLYVRESKVAGDDFYAVVEIEKFSKLISKLTCDEVTIEIPKSKKGELDNLVIHGNGKYVIELPYDEEGELIEFEDPVAEIGGGWEETEVNLSTIHLLLNTAKASLLLGSDASCYRGYYCGDRVITTDSYKICGVDIQLFNEPKLLYPDFMDLLNVISEEKINVKYNEDTLIFSTNTITVYGKIMENIEKYKIEAISNLLDEDYGSSCKIEKLPLAQMLERLSLFVDSQLDDNSVYLTFTKDGLLVTSKRDSGEEIIPYKESSDFKDFTCCLDIDMFKSQIKAYQGDVIEVCYGKDSCIKLLCGNTTQLIALADDDREGEGE